MNKSIYLVVDYEVNLQICVHVTLIHYEKYFWIVNPGEKVVKSPHEFQLIWLTINVAEAHL